MKKNRLSIFVLIAVFLSFASFSIMAAKGKTDSKKTTVDTKKSDTKTTTQTNTSTTTKISNTTTYQPQTTSPASPATGETIPWQVLSAGATNGSSTNYSLGGTLGQTAPGIGSSANYGLNGGFWQDFGASCCVLPGDFNSDGTINIKDLTDHVKWQFKSGGDPSCFSNVDVNNDCTLNILDLTYRVKFQFKGGAPLECGCID